MKTVIIGERYKEKFENALKNNKIDVFWLPENPNIDLRLASHTDLSMFVYANNAVLAKYLENEFELVKILTKRGYKLKFLAKEQGSLYPNDVNLCASVIGDKIIHNSKYTDSEILELGVECINVNQGYARCTTLVIDDSSLITADNGIAAAAEKAGIDVLHINGDGIDLPGYDRGFIGGASFKTEDTVYFFGELDTHPDAEKIREFITKRGLDVCSLCEGTLLDIGGAVYLK